MNKILYCPWCDRYAREPWYHCPFCHSQTIYIKAWEKKSEENKKEWLEKFPKVDPPRPTKDKSLLREAEKFDKQTRAQLEEEARLAQYKPTCPVCHCPDLEKISGFDKTLDIAVWGVWSRKAHKQFKCKNCGYEF